MPKGNNIALWEKRAMEKRQPKNYRWKNGRDMKWTKIEREKGDREIMRIFA